MSELTAVSPLLKHPIPHLIRFMVAISNATGDRGLRIDLNNLVDLEIAYGGGGHGLALVRLLKPRGSREFWIVGKTDLGRLPTMEVWISGYNSDQSSGFFVNAQAKLTEEDGRHVFTDIDIELETGREFDAGEVNTMVLEGLSVSKSTTNARIVFDTPSIDQSIRNFAAFD